MAFNLSAASNILKVRYIGTIREQLNNATVLLSKIGRQDQMVSGKTFTVPLHSGRNKSAGTGVSDGGTLPTAGQQSYETTIVPNKYLYGRIQVTGPTIAATRDNVGAFVEALNSEVDGLMRDFKRDLNRQLCGDGTGALAYWTSADDASGAIIDDGLGNVSALHLQSGVTTCDLIDASDGTTNLSTANMVVTLGAATSTGYAVTWTGLVTGSADGDFLVRAGTMVAAGSLEMMGIGGIISASDPSGGAGGSLQGLAVGSYSFWKAQDFGSDSTQVALAFEDIQEVIDAIATQSDYTEQDIAFLFSNYGVRRAYYKLCIAERRHVNTMELDGGFKAVDFNGIPWVVDSQAKRNTISFIVPDTMKIFRTSDFDWMDKDGSYLSRVANADAYEAVLFHYGNLACLSRNGNGILRGILEA
jgi:hypothetical protein